MLNPVMARTLAEAHRNDLLQDAARYRVRRQGRAAAQRRARVVLGRLLITAGVRLAAHRPADEIPRLWPHPL